MEKSKLKVVETGASEREPMREILECTAHPENCSGLLPAGHAVLVEPYDLEEGIIAIPDATKERTRLLDARAVVLAVGPNAWQGETAGPRAEVGDHVMITNYCGFKATGPLDGKMYKLVNENDIFALITTEVRVRDGKRVILKYVRE